MRRMLAGPAALALLAVPLAAQYPPLVLPRVSQRASVSQHVGLTEISISYHRPAVAGRQVWGALVPFDVVWRAGANENTVIAFSSPVRVAGREVPPGRYGLHMIPGREEWTVILSRQASAWGSFAYDPEEDFLRVRARPFPTAESQEQLVYTFESPGEDSVVALLRWEKLAVPLPIAVNTRQVVADSLREQLTGAPQFFWQPWAQAAAWCLANDFCPEQAAEWSERSLAIQENFTNLRVKAAVLEQQGDSAAAVPVRQRAFSLATEADMNTYGYELLGEGLVDSAIVIFRKNVKDYPRSWNTWDSLGEALAKKGDRKGAVEAYTRARRMTRDPSQQRRIDGVLAGLT